MITIVYSMSTPARPTKPSSSPTAAMMKSVEAAGTVPGWPLPSPVPKMPPVAKLNSDWTI
ncbi:Uncharacterised protein [Mycobacteroides abscessus subsp. abscessus]|nr:Uncharacterised protein [Mycobacteroides abscessus subsp. abscessus]